MRLYGVVTLKRHALADVAEIAPQFRAFAIDERSAIDEDARTVEVIASTEAPVERWFGFEILDHKPTSVRLDRVNDGSPLLSDHDHARQIGVIVPGSARLEGGKLKATVRFSRSEEGEKEFQDVRDGIRNKLSIGYRLHEVTLVDKDGEVETYRSDNWEPHEVSLVSVPADTGAKVGRSEEGGNATRNQPNPITIRTVKEKEKAPKAEPKASAEVKPETGTETRSPNTETEVRTISGEDVERALINERNRTNEIRTIGKEFELGDLADEHAAKGTSVDDFRKLALGVIKERHADPVVHPGGAAPTEDKRVQKGLVRPPVP